MASSSMCEQNDIDVVLSQASPTTHSQDVKVEQVTATVDESLSHEWRRRPQMKTISQPSARVLRIVDGETLELTPCAAFSSLKFSAVVVHDLGILSLDLKITGHRANNSLAQVAHRRYKTTSLDWQGIKLSEVSAVRTFHG